MKAKVYDQEVDGFSGKSAEEQYVDYCFEQQRCLDDLDALIKQSASSNQHNAMVGAIRAKGRGVPQPGPIGAAISGSML